MSLRNTSLTYGTIAKGFHWITAIGFFISYCAIYYREWFVTTDRESWISIQLHFSIGLNLVLIVLLRVCWRLFDSPPKTIEQRPTLDLCKRTVHTALYLVMFLMPITGFLSKGDYFLCGNGKISFYFLYELKFLYTANFCSAFESNLANISQPMENIHIVLGNWIALPLIVFHICAALYHHIILKDNTLTKITFSNTTT